jgi:hypothetical protein
MDVLDRQRGFAEGNVVSSRSAGTAEASSTGPSSGPVSPVSPAPSATVSPSSGAASQPIASSSPSVVLKPARLATLRGYSYVAAPPPVVAAFKPVARGYVGVLSAPTIRSVRRNSVIIGSVAAMTIEPNSARDTALVDTLVTGLVKGMTGKGYTLRSRAVGGKRVVVAFRKGSTLVAWVHRGAVVTMVTSEPEATPLAFARAYLAS